MGKVKLSFRGPTGAGARADLRSRMLRGLGVLFVFLIVFNMQAAFAVSYSSSIGISGQSGQGTSTQSLASETEQASEALQAYQNSGLESFSQAYLAEAKASEAQAASSETQAPGTFSCNTRSLTPEEVQLLKQEVNDKGVRVGQIDSGTEANTDRKSLPQNKMILTDDKETTAVKQEMPSKEADIFEVANLLNKNVKGAFAIGLKLDDTLRVARCTGIPSASCTVDGGNLKWRNSGSGIKADFGNVFKDLKSVFDGDKFVEGMSKDELEKLKVAAEQDGADAENSTEYKRILGNPIKNYVKADLFTAKIMTNCDNGACTINTYSLFDKLFNSYFSTTMVASSIAPELIGRTGKLFGWMGRRGISMEAFLPKKMKNAIDKIKQGFDEGIMKSKITGQGKLTPSALYGNIRAGRMATNINKYDFKAAFHDPLFPKELKITSTGGFHGWLGSKETQEFLESLSKDPERRKAFFDVVTDYKGYFDTLNTMKTIEYKNAFGPGSKMETFLKNKIVDGKPLTINSPREDILKALATDNSIAAQEAQASLRTYGQNITKLFKDVDDSTALDLGEFIQITPEFGLSKLAVYNNTTGEYVHMPSNVRTLRENLEKVYAKTGSFSGTGFGDKGQAASKLAVDAKTGGLKLFKVDPAGRFVAEVPPADLEIAITQGKYADTFAKLGTGELVPLNSRNLKAIKGGTTGNVKLFESGWTDAGIMTPEDYSLRLVDRMDYYLGKPSQSLTILQNTLVERGFATRRSFSWLDKMMVEEQQLIKSYFSPKGGLKWTVLPFVYWEAKRGLYDVSGLENFSAYQLPDTWFRIAYKTGSQPIYSDAMIDFFGREGSDQGDVFVQVINLGIWKQVIDNVSGTYPPAQQAIKKFTGEGMRSTTEDLAVYVSGPEKCDNCTMVISSDNSLETLSPAFYSSEALNTYILEAPSQATFEKKGQTLIAFARHMNLSGQSGSVPGDEINLAKASADKTSCADAISGMDLIGIPVGKILPKDAKAGGVLALGESIGYVAFNLGFGLTGSVVQQTMLIPKLRDCVDTEGGYYTHIMVPPKEEEEKPTNVTQYSSKNVAKIIEDNAQKYLDSLKGTDNQLTKSLVEQMQKQLDKITGNALDSQIVEALAHTEGSSSGKMVGYKLFYFWCQGGCEITPSSYPTKGKERLVDKEKDVTIEADKEKGVLTANGKTIITNADAVRLESINTQIPAKEIPNTLTYIGLPNTNELYFQMNASGGMTVKSSSVLNCLQSGVKAQTGIELVSNDLREAFGSVENVVTDAHPLIKPLGDKIIAEGYPRMQASGKDAVLDIYANRNTQLSPLEAGIDSYAGKLTSIQFQNGIMVWKPETNELVVWLKHHEKAILTQDDVTGLKATKTTVKNALTNCIEPAISLAVQGDPNSELSQLKATQFNKSLEAYGPFQSFETPTHLFIFYSKLEAGECKDYFKVINKKTGEVETDSPITSFSQDGSKLEIKTADGKTHTLEFGAEKGVPNLAYNGGSPETLTMAQGRKGAFYYDPEKGLWYADNAQLIPLLDAFKQQGYSEQVRPDGTVSAVPGYNLTMVNPQQQSGFNLLSLPSLPENALLLSFTIIAMLGLIVFVRFRVTKARKAKN